MVKSTLVVMPTGTGKTVVMGTTAQRWRKGRILMIAHREELIYQAADKFSRVCGETCGVEMADDSLTEDWDKPRIVVASVQSLNSKHGGRHRFEKFDPMEFGLVMTDEAHHATATTYRRIYEHFGQNPDLRHLGVTATPDRADEEALGQIFDSVAYEYQILDAINQGYLVPIEQQFVHCEALDLSSCKSDKHDLRDGDVARVMEQEAMLHKVVIPTMEIAGSRATLVFASSVAHAQKMEELFNRYKPHSAISIDGNTDKEIRRLQLKKFGAGEYQYLCNCGVFLEGFDEPRIGVVSMARPTKSRALYAQCIGRGTRPLPGVIDGLDTAEERLTAIRDSGKPAMLALDFVGNSGKHKLVSTADILGGNESDDVIERAEYNAKKKAEQGEKVNMQRELELAREELEEEVRKRQEQSEAARAARNHIKAKAKFNAQRVDPFSVFDVLPPREPGWHKGRKPTEGMINALRRFKVEERAIQEASFWQAKTMLDTLTKRAAQGLCTLKQANILKRYGYPTEQLSFSEASGLIDRIAKNNWQRPKE